MSSPSRSPLEAAHEHLMRRCAVEMRNAEATNFRLLVDLDLHTLISIVGLMQLALRHPGATGPSAEIARRAIDGMIAKLRECGLMAHAELARLGDNPESDDV